jgi:hypothetical protein
MRAMLPSGETVMVTKRRIRDEEVLIDRDLDFLVKLAQGSRKADIAKRYKVTVRLINRRLKDVPRDVKVGVVRLVCQYDDESGPGFVPDAALDPLRSRLRRARRGQGNVGQLQASRVG